MALIGASFACFLTAALLGPSIMQPALRGSAGHPPYSLHLNADPHVVIALVAAGILTGGAGLSLTLVAIRAGWTISVRLLLVAGVIGASAFTLLPPTGSSDHLNYAAYGRMVITGHDPYRTRPLDLPDDPVVSAVEDWKKAPSVYGPVATLQQAFSAMAGGTSVRLTVFFLSVTNTLAFIAVGLALTARERGKRIRQRRAAILWTLNPLLQFQVVSGAHNDVIMIAFGVAALWMLSGSGRWRVIGAGASIGAGIAVKIPAILIAMGMAWPALRSRLPHVWSILRIPSAAPSARFFGERRALAVSASLGIVVAALLYAFPYGDSFSQVNNASKMVSYASPWHLVEPTLRHAVGFSAARMTIKVCTLVVAAVVAVMLVRSLPRLDSRPVDEAAQAALSLSLAWLFTAPYLLPWYDSMGWALLAFVPWSRFDWLLLAHTLVLSLAYLPARTKGVAALGDMHYLFTVVRQVVAPWALFLLLSLLVLQCVRPWRGPARVTPDPTLG